MKLKLAEDLALPLEAVTEVLAFLGRRGQGKSYAAQKLAELLYEAGAQFVALDPVGIWYGLRLAADGKGPGIPIPVLGGLHGDLPLEPGAGKLVADLIVDRGISAVLDVSQFEADADKARFAHDFAARFYYRRKQAPAAVHVFLEEAQEFVPQNPASYGGAVRGDRGVNEARMLHVFQRMAKLGRNYGIGLSLISQRPQEVHKKVLNLTELLFAFQLTGPHERKAVEGWIEDKGIDEDISAELPRLERGAPHAWSPAWLKISEVVHIKEKWTFDSSSTPKLGVKAEAKTLALIDLEKIKKDMAATIERAKAEDPRELRRQLQERDREITKLRNSVIASSHHLGTQVAQKRVEIPILKDAQIARLDSFGGKLLQAAEAYAVAGQRGVAIATDLRAFGQELAAAIRTAKNGSQAPPIPVRPMHPITPRVIRAPQTSAPHGVQELTRPQQRILDALAWFEAVGLPAPEKAPLAAMAGASSRSSAYQNNVSALRSAGLVDYPRGGLVALTESGRARATPPDVPGTTAALQDAVFAKVTRPQARILQALIDAYPRAVTKEELAERAEASAASSAFQNNVSAMRSLGLVDYPAAGHVVALPVLFLEDARR